MQVGPANPQILPPEDQWYKRPTLWEAPQIADARLFFWFAEVLPRQNPVGVTFRLSAALVAFSTFDVFFALSAAAKGELYRRINNNFFFPPADTIFNLFAWTPVITRDARGVISIGDGQVTDVQINTDNTIVIVNPAIGVVPPPTPTPIRLVAGKDTGDVFEVGPGSGA
jgi:hypothetical protein